MVAGCVERLVALEAVAETVRRGVGVALVVVRGAVVVARFAVAEVRAVAGEADFVGDVVLAALELLGAEGTRFVAAAARGGLFCESVVVFRTDVAGAALGVDAGLAAEGAAGVAFFKGVNCVGRAGLVPFTSAVLFVSAGSRLYK